jgi:NADPH-dependent 2,4-dienoyl-CoA reductase/sulfur reductase-like enzyme
MTGRRILVIGGLAAGPSAASKAVRTNPAAQVVLFEQGEHISYGICEIPYHIGGEVPAEGLVSYTPEKLRREKGVDARTLHRVQEIIPRRRTIVVHDIQHSRTFEEQYDRLIVATGSSPKRLDVPGEDARNIFHVKTLTEAYLLSRYIDVEKPAKAVIIGGGYIGMEMADALRARGMEVALLHRFALPMHSLERETREEVRAVLESNGVEFVPEAATEGFVVGKEQKTTHVLTSKGSYAADLVILAIGVSPNVDLARQAGIRLGTHGGILTDSRQQTSVDNIYAAGDCCEVKNLVTGQWSYVPLATLASKAGWAAGENAAGGKACFRGAIRAVAVRVFQTEFAQVGISVAEAEAAGFDVVTDVVTAWSRVAVMPGSRKVTIRTIADRRSHRLLGANVSGEEGAVLRANTLAVAIQHRITVDEIQQWDLAYSPPFTPLWDPILISANTLRKKL